MCTKFSNCPILFGGFSGHFGSRVSDCTPPNCPKKPKNSDGPCHSKSRHGCTECIADLAHPAVDMDASQPKPSKRRIVLGAEHRVVTATSTAAPTAAAPAALTRTPAQLAEELRRDAWTIEGAMTQWKGLSDLQFQYVDSADLDAVSATLRRMAARLQEYQASVKAQQERELADEAARCKSCARSTICRRRCTFCTARSWPTETHGSGAAPWPTPQRGSAESGPWFRVRARKPQSESTLRGSTSSRPEQLSSSTRARSCSTTTGSRDGCSEPGRGSSAPLLHFCWFRCVGSRAGAAAESATLME